MMGVSKCIFWHFLCHNGDARDGQSQPFFTCLALQECGQIQGQKQQKNWGNKKGLLPLKRGTKKVKENMVETENSLKLLSGFFSYDGILYKID